MHVLANWTLGYTPPPVHPLSIDAGMTFVTLGLFVALTVFLLGLIRGVRGAGLDRLVSGLMGLGVTLAVFGVIQAAALDKSNPLLYGFWRPRYGATPFGPFVNKNHFAGWMVMAIPVGLGAFVARVTVARRLRLRIGDARAARLAARAVVLVVMCLTVVLTGSRSGMASLALAVAFVGAVAWVRPETRPFRTSIAAGLAGLGAIALLWGGVGSTVARFADSTVGFQGRAGAWRDTARIIHDFPLFGTGLGTYSEAMLVYQTVDRTSMSDQAHNDYLQLAAEGGVLVGIPAAIAAALVVAGAWRRFRTSEDDLTTRWVRTGAIAGLCGIAAQSIVEFSLQMPGNTAMCAVLMAIALHRPHRESTDAHRV